MNKNLAIKFILLTYFFTGIIEIPKALTSYSYASVHIPKGVETISTLSPGFVAILLTAIYFKKRGLLLLSRSIVKWRINIKWYLIIFFGGIGLCGLSFLIFNLLFAQTNYPDEPYNFIFYFLLILPLSALWEEIGWRGFLLPILQQKYTPLQASLLIGFIWGLWHLPIYMALNPYGSKTIIYFFYMFFGCFALSIIQTWIYNATGGNLLICILFHNTVNTSAAYFYGNLKGSEFRPFIIWIILLVITALGLSFKSNMNFKHKPTQI